MSDKLKKEVSPDYADGYARGQEDVYSLFSQESIIGRMHKAEKQVEEDTKLFESLEWSGAINALSGEPTCPECCAVKGDPHGRACVVMGESFADCALAKRLGR